MSNFKQYDTRWAKLPYPKKPYYIKDCGCGEVAIANVITEMLNQRSQTPKTIQPFCKQYADPNGNGTYWDGIPAMMKHYGLTEVQEHQTMKSLWKELAKGNRVAIYLMGKKAAGSKGVHWTSEGHFVASTNYRYKDHKHEVYMKDSNSTSSSRNGWISYEENMRGDVLKVWSGKLKTRKPYSNGLPNTVIQKGCQGVEVKHLQKFLNWYFGIDLDVDGICGNQTVKWIKKFQKDNGLSADGIFGSQSKAKAKKIIKKYAPPFWGEITKMGQACSNEKGGMEGGKAGDQGGEVVISRWSYSATSGAYNNWIAVYRAKDPEMRAKLAQAMIDTCENDHIGYDTSKPDRYTAYDEAEKKNWDIKAITKNCETTCSQAVSMCLRAAGVPKKYAPRHSDIAALTKAMNSDDLFYKYTSKAYTSKTDKLMYGDIVMSGTHTAIIVETPNAQEAEQ